MKASKETIRFKRMGYIDKPRRWLTAGSNRWTAVYIGQRAPVRFQHWRIVSRRPVVWWLEGHKVQHCTYTIILKERQMIVLKISKIPKRGKRAMIYRDISKQDCDAKITGNSWMSSKTCPKLSSLSIKQNPRDTVRTSVSHTSYRGHPHALACRVWERE